jgi:hypothetical protein
MVVEFQVEERGLVLEEHWLMPTMVPVMVRVLHQALPTTKYS